MGGIMYAGGHAEFDIVFDNGSRSSRLPKCILHGVQWRICEELATADEIAAALSYSDNVIVTKKAAEQQTKNAYSREVERLKAAPEYTHLEQYDGKTYTGKLAAINMRTELKRAFKGVKFSVRTDSNCVRISWTDGVIKAQVEEIANKYKSGGFNGMEDIYEHSQSPWKEVFGSTMYLSTNRTESPELAQKAIDSLFEQYSCNFEGIKKPMGEAYKNGDTWRFEVPGFSERLQTLISRKVATMIG